MTPPLFARLRACLLIAICLLIPACAEENDEAVANSSAAIAPPAKPVVADYAGVLRRSDGRVDIPTMIERLRSLHVNTYAFLIWGWRYQMPASQYYATDFDDLRQFTAAAEKVGIKVWAYLASPQEMKMYAPPPCKADYACWGDVIGALAAEHPNLETIVVDDFFAKPNVGDLGPDVASAMNSAARKHAPAIKFYPIAYYTNAMLGLLGHDYSKSIDGVVFVDLNRTIADSDKFFPDQLAQMTRVLRSPVEAMNLHVPASAGAQRAEQASLSKTGAVGAGPHVVTFGVGDDLFGKTGQPAVAGGEGARVLQLVVSGNKAWERDLNAPPAPGETPGFQRVTVDLDALGLAKTKNATITFRVLATRDQAGMPPIDVRVYDVGVTNIALEPDWKKLVAGDGGWDANAVTRTYDAGIVEMVYASTLAGGWTPDKDFIVHGVAKAGERIKAGQLEGVMTYQLDKTNTGAGSTFAALASVYAGWDR